MASRELDNFVYKFKDLWRNGREATLTLNSRAGEAWIQLHVGLGRPLDLPPPQHYDNQGAGAGNSRDRRRNRRARDREVASRQELSDDNIYDNENEQTGAENVLNATTIDSSEQEKHF